MANKVISDLDAITSLESDDLMVVEQSTDDVYKKVEVGVTLSSLLVGGLVVGSDTMTIDSGEITVDSNTPVFITLNGEGASTDALTTITGGVAGQVFIFQMGDAAITIEDGTDNINLAGSNFELATIRDKIGIISRGANKDELFRNAN